MGTMAVRWQHDGDDEILIVIFFEHVQSFFARFYDGGDGDEGSRMVANIWRRHYVIIKLVYREAMKL